MQTKHDSKINSTVSSAVSFDNKANPMRDSDQKQIKPAFDNNKSNRVKNTLFGIHKEEANNITK